MIPDPDPPSSRETLAAPPILRNLWREVRLRRASFGVAFACGFSAFMVLTVLKLTRLPTPGGSGSGLLASALAIAILTGWLLGRFAASLLLRRRIELGWVPVAGVAMTLTTLGLAAIDPAQAAHAAAAARSGPVALIPLVFTTPAGAFLWLTALLAFFTTVFHAPLRAWIKNRHKSGEHDPTKAAIQLQNGIAILLATLLATLGDRWFAPLLDGEAAVLRLHFILAAAACGLITVFIVRLLPRDIVRVLGLAVIRTIYHIRPVGAENVPKSGGALLLPNHISWLDAFFLTAACPRPVRFVMEAGFMKYPAVRAFCRLFDTVPITSAKPREALRAAAAALAAGDVVCLFPEGQLSRTGALCELKRGLEIIARQTRCPSIPVWADGAWGSIFSFERNRFFRKIPHRNSQRLLVAFGPPLVPADSTLPAIRAGILESSAATLAQRARRPAWHRDAPAVAIVQAAPFADPDLRPRLWANGYQLGQINALQRRRTFALLEQDPGISRLGALAAFASLFRARPQLHTSPEGAIDTLWLGSEALRDLVESSPPPARPSVFFDFSSELRTIERPGWTHCPCLAVDGIIVAMSFPDPPPSHAASPHQPGRKPGSRGILLPGFRVRESSGLTLVLGPAAPSDGLALPPGARIDGGGFIFLPGENQARSS